VKDGRLELTDSMTGPGTVSLNAAGTQAILMRHTAHGNGERAWACPSDADRPGANTMAFGSGTRSGPRRASGMSASITCVMP